MAGKVALILINYKDYARRYLPECLESLRRQDYLGESQIFIVDNESSLETQTYLKQLAPEAEMIVNKNNDGFAKGNNDALRLALALNYSYAILFNMDTIVERGAVRKMVEAAELDTSIGAVQARLMLHPETTKINSLGNSTHFLGFGFCKNYHEDFDNNLTVRDIMYPSGAAVLFNLKALNVVGLFDEKLWMYNEDQDLGWRLWLADYRCVLAPAAVVYHKYEFSRSITKYYWMDRNRLIVMFKNYSCLTLFLILPAFVIMEIGLVLFSLKAGWFKDKLRVWWFFLKPTTWIYLYRTRRAVQKSRLVREVKILPLISGRIWYQELGDKRLQLINPLFNLYWQGVKIIIKLVDCGRKACKSS